VRFRPVAPISVIVIVLAACTGAATSSPPSPPPSAAPSALTIYGAASLKTALARIKTAYESANPGMTLTIATDSSAALEAQIEQGAPADVFLSADTTNPQKLVDRGLAAGPVVPFASNVLAVIVPASNPAGIRSPADLAKPGVKVVAAGDSVPITKYVVQLVGNLAKQAGYPAGFAAGYAANIASREDNVAAVVSKIELGEGDAAIVYATDAKASTTMATIAIPDASNVRATYGGVAVKASRNVAAAEAFLAWLVGSDGQAILASLGFLPPS